jgi:hypothetical protein
VTGSIHDVFERRLQRHIARAADELAAAQRQVMAEFAARHLLQSGARRQRQTQVRNTHVSELVEWCLAEVLSFSRTNGMQPQAHGDQLRPHLLAFMASSREGLKLGALGDAASQAIAAILDKADAHITAELDEFSAGAWRPREQSKVGAVTNNNVTLTNSMAGNIQQAGDFAQQDARAFDGAALQQALSVFEREVGEVEISDEARAAIKAEVDTIRPQLGKREPSSVIVRESLKTLRNLVEGLAAGALTPSFVALLTAAAPLVGAMIG